MLSNCSDEVPPSLNESLNSFPLGVPTSEERSPRDYCRAVRLVRHAPTIGVSNARARYC